ncbi:hypothetical protein V1282_005755 [Nitrobacteraceae bacterium AZCC 2146]
MTTLVLRGKSIKEGTPLHRSSIKTTPQLEEILLHHFPGVASGVWIMSQKTLQSL